MSVGETVHLIPGQRPPDYHCTCEFCQKVIGELRQPSGDYYSRLERRQYYGKSEKGKSGHIAKSPLHIARWAVQQYSAPGDWVLDPTIGAGTTAVEAVTQGRNAAGMELEYGDVLRENIKAAMAIANGERPQVKIGHGDARNIGAFFEGLGPFQLVVNNPPYSGDVSMPSPAKEGRGKQFRDKETTFFYDKTLPNLAFLKEGLEYWSTMEDIYRACVDRLAPGGHFVIGIKDMSRQKQPFLLHKQFCELLARIGLDFVGTAFLKHHPGTLFLNTCEQLHGFKPPKYQTINVFQKPVPRQVTTRRRVA